jgi:hypothetical protein
MLVFLCNKQASIVGIGRNVTEPPALHCNWLQASISPGSSPGGCECFAQKLAQQLRCKASVWLWRETKKRNETKPTPFIILNK